jgi:chemotaxis methyl-accepting protein methylase
MHDQWTESSLPDNNIGLRNLLEYIHKSRGIDFTLYRFSTFRRRLELRLAETSTHNYREYLEYLRSHPDEIDIFIQAVTIKLSNFFRDPLVYEFLYSYVLPEMLTGNHFLNIWSVGCARGEEPYSLAIMIHDLRKLTKKSCDVKILGTDIDPEALKQAMKGEYREDDLFEVKKKYLDRYFTRPQNSGRTHTTALFRISDEIKSMVTFERADIINSGKLRDTLSNNYQLILCRNVLIYVNRNFQEKVQSNLSEMISENGYLVIGETETLAGSFRDFFIQTFPQQKIFKKKPLGAGR